MDIENKYSAMVDGLIAEGKSIADAFEAARVAIFADIADEGDAQEAWWSLADIGTPAVMVLAMDPPNPKDWQGDILFGSGGMVVRLQDGEWADVEKITASWSKGGKVALDIRWRDGRGLLELAPKGWKSFTATVGISEALAVKAADSWEDVKVYPA